MISKILKYIPTHIITTTLTTCKYLVLLAIKSACSTTTYHDKVSHL